MVSSFLLRFPNGLFFYYDYLIRGPFQWIIHFLSVVFRYEGYNENNARLNWPCGCAGASQWCVCCLESKSALFRFSPLQHPSLRSSTWSSRLQMKRLVGLHEQQRSDHRKPPHSFPTGVTWSDIKIHLRACGWKSRDALVAYLVQSAASIICLIGYNDGDNNGRVRYGGESTSETQNWIRDKTNYRRCMTNRSAALREEVPSDPAMYSYDTTALIVLG